MGILTTCKKDTQKDENDLKLLEERLGRSKVLAVL